MENRLELNKRPTYELPDEVVVMLYKNQEGHKSHPNFEPDICINAFGNRCIAEKKSFMHQIWVKTTNGQLIDFIKTYRFDAINSFTKDSLPVWKVKKIILEEFYGVKHGK